MSKPILLIPGFGGSMLINKKHPYNNYFNRKILNNRWINLYPLSTKYMERWKKDMHMELNRDPSTNRILSYHNINHDIIPYDMYGIQGIQNLVPEFNYLNENYQQFLENTFHYQYFYNLNNYLLEMDYLPYENLIGMPYDFRTILDPDVRNSYFKNLKVVIKSRVRKFGKKMFVISHSLGGILFKWFLSEYVDQAFMDKYIDCFVMINTPFGGTPSAVKASLIGEFYIPFMHSLFSQFTSKVSGIIMTLPNPLCYKDSDVFLHLEDSKDSISLQSFYNTNHLPFEIWKDLYLPHLQTIAKPLHVKSKLVLSTENQTAKAFYSKNLDTSPFKIDYDMNGDGLIPSKSLTYGTKLFYNYEMLNIPKTDHVGIMSHPIFLDKVQQWILE